MTELLAHNVAAHWAQAAGVAGAAWLAAAVLRLREPGFLLRYWQGVLVLLLLTPWLQPWRPVSAIPAGGGSPPAGLEPAAAGVQLPAAGSVAALPADGWSLDPWTWVLGLAAAGAVVRLAWLGAGLARLGRLARAAHRVAPPEPAREFLARFGVSAAFVQPPDVGMPCSFGLFRPIVMLPVGFHRLEPAFQRAIVCHELVHVGRRDFAAAVLEEVAAALLWFHPWVWLIRRRVRLHREQVVDAAVVRCTGDRRAYVRCLVALAGHPRALGPAAPMARSTELRARTDALFDKEGTMSKRRSAVFATGLCAALGATVWTAAATVPLRAAPVPPAPAAVTIAVGGTLALGGLEGPAPVAPGSVAAPGAAGGAPAMVRPDGPAPVPPGPAAVTAAAGGAPAMVRSDGPAPVPLGAAASVPPSVTAAPPGAAAAPPGTAPTGPAMQEPGTGGRATRVENHFVLEFTLPGGRLPRVSSREGELTSITLQDVGTLGFVARRRGAAGGMVTVTVFDTDSDPDRELGAVDVRIGGEPVTLAGPVPIEIAVSGIVYSASAGSLPDGPEGRLARMARSIAENLARGDEPGQADARARTAAVMEELRQALAAMADRLGSDETAAGELAQPFAELQERFAELQELLAGR